MKTSTNILISGYLIITSSILPSCNSKSNEKSTDKISDQFNRSLSQIQNLDTKDLKKQAANLGSLTTEQLQALTQIEYRIVEISTADGITMLQSNLQALGKDRWDCYAMDNAEKTKWNLVCKRYPLNYFGFLKGMLGF